MRTTEFVCESSELMVLPAIVRPLRTTLGVASSRSRVDGLRTTHPGEDGLLQAEDPRLEGRDLAKDLGVALDKPLVLCVCQIALGGRVLQA